MSRSGWMTVVEIAQATGHEALNQGNKRGHFYLLSYLELMISTTYCVHFPSQRVLSTFQKNKSPGRSKVSAPFSSQVNPRQFIHWLLLFLLHADAQNPFIELIHGPRCLATLVELLCVVFNHCKVLSFILYQKKKNRKSRRKTEKPSEKDIAQTVSSSCKLNHRIQVSLGR